MKKALSLPPEERYVASSVKKADGSTRAIFKPHNLIRKIQRRINRRIFKTLVIWPSYLYGSIPNTIDPTTKKVIEHKDYVNCAAQHCSSKSLLKMDIKDFFDNIHRDYVSDIFTVFFKFPPDVSEALTSICCRENTLVQGALTSSYLANLVLWDIEGDLVKKLNRKNLTYTRLVDDITVSSKVSNFQFDLAISLISSALISKELPINTSKTQVSYVSSNPLTVHGMRVNFPEPRYPSDEVRKLRASVHNLQCLASQPGYRQSHSYRKDYACCMGRVNKLKRVKHEKHAVLIKKLNKIKPLPSEVDQRRCKQMLRRLQNDYKNKHLDYWYCKRFYRLHDRLNVLQRKSCFRDLAEKIREEMRLIKPTYDQ
ncbi:reverse transcriptase family protein [Vibrio lentus]|uniref:reverse transcriptase family protein n=1 Tax=Vibrio lentus TaxID=136468 RepID=UPI001F539F37|nr:reverse transcriptase family protein [Vibrio lentus]